MSYLCSCCGQTHGDMPHLAFDRPAYAHSVPEYERAERVWLTDDLCVVDGEHHFVRGLIEIPVHGQGEPFGIGAWVSQKREHFHAYVEHFDSAEIGPFFGWLSNEFAFGGEPTLNLKAMVHFRGGGLRPLIELEPTGHPLALAQREGIGVGEAWALIHQYVGPSAP